MGLERTATAASGMPRSGDPFTRTLPPASSRSAGSASRCSAAMSFAFSATIPAATAIALPAMIAARHLDIGDVYSQLVGHDLRPDGGMRLSLVWDAGRGHHLARDQHLHVRALVGPDPSPFDIRAEAHADVIALGSRAEHLERPLHKRRIVAAVVHDLVSVLPHDADLVRKLVRLNEVAATDIDAVEP